MRPSTYPRSSASAHVSAHTPPRCPVEPCADQGCRSPIAAVPSDACALVSRHPIPSRPPVGRPQSNRRRVRPRDVPAGRRRGIARTRFRDHPDIRCSPPRATDHAWPVVVAARAGPRGHLAGGRVRSRGRGHAPAQGGDHRGPLGPRPGQQGGRRPDRQAGERRGHARGERHHAPGDLEARRPRHPGGEPRGLPGPRQRQPRPQRLG